MNCLTTTWSAHEAEMLHWVRRRRRNPVATDDLMQDLFLKALRQGERFCSVHNARAWVFEVARETVELHQDLSALMDMPYRFNPGVNLLSFVFSAGIGVLFGYFPARRAARMDPIEALRHE